ncbi:MAG: DEAD/DEAH box helicase [Spirochaetia bacterium]|nr:DEAD/DEAH box helicase [Spirochaetia bacterium]
MKFNEFSLSPQILKAVEELGFEEPTPVQEQVIPLLLDTDRDLVGLSQTGTGKTAAFGLPILEKINFDYNGPQALILCPTRELCMQIYRDFLNFSRFMQDPGITAVYGGAPYRQQLQELRQGARIIIATPGRLRDLINKGAAVLENLSYLILDEADTMLNMGFKEELDEILSTIPPGKQTFLFSATMPPDVARIAKSYMQNPLEVTMGAKNSGANNIEHKYIMVHARDKFQVLKRLVDYYPGVYGIVFCRTRTMTRDLAEKLMKAGYNADSLHGDLSQQQREYVMTRFRDKSLHLLVATDIAARGLDVQDLTHIFHYDLPDDMEIYNHRSGRTGRAGKSGESIAIINMRERSKMQRLEQMIKQKISESTIPSGKDICEQQLLFMIDRIKASDFDESLIKPYLPIIEKKLEGIEKGELLQRVVALEFNRFLNFYGNIPDLTTANSERGGRRGREERDSGRQTRDRGGRDRESWDRDRGPRSRPRQPDFADRERSQTNDDRYTWLTINLGTQDSFYKKDLLGLINRNSQGMHVELGVITSDLTFTRFQVFPEARDMLFKTLSRITVEGKRLRIKESDGGESGGSGYSEPRRSSGAGTSDRPVRSGRSGDSERPGGSGRPGRSNSSGRSGGPGGYTGPKKPYAGKKGGKKK